MRINLALYLVPFIVVLSISLFYEPASYFSIVVYLAFVHRMWKSIEDSGLARTTPNKAVLYHLVPVFNVYWVFQALWGFAHDFNCYVDALVKKRSLTLRRLPTGLFLSFAILFYPNAVGNWMASKLAEHSAAYYQQPLPVWSSFLPFAGLISLAWGVLAVLVMVYATKAVNRLADALEPGGKRTTRLDDNPRFAAPANGKVEPPEELYSEGCRLLDTDEYAAAVGAFTKCTEADPGHADAWHNRGYCLVELGRLSEAVDSFSRALALQPEDSATLFARGLAREASGEYAGAAADFEHYVSGSGALDQEKIAYARKAIDSASNRLTSGAASGQASVEAVRADDTEDARRLLLSDPNVWLRKGLVLVERREWRDAVTCLGKVLALKPNDPDALFGLAQAEDALGAVGSSMEHFGQFLIYTPPDDRSRIEMAQRRLRDISTMNPAQYQHNQEVTAPELARRLAGDAAFVTRTGLCEVPVEHREGVLLLPITFLLAMRDTFRTIREDLPQMDEGVHLVKLVASRLALPSPDSPTMKPLKQVEPAARRTLAEIAEQTRDWNRLDSKQKLAAVCARMLDEEQRLICGGYAPSEADEISRETHIRCHQIIDAIDSLGEW